MGRHQCRGQRCGSPLPIAIQVGAYIGSIQGDTFVWSASMEPGQAYGLGAANEGGAKISLWALEFQPHLPLGAEMSICVKVYEACRLLRPLQIRWEIVHYKFFAVIS